MLPSLLGLPASRQAETVKHARADEIIELLGLSSFADRICGELSTGTRRFAELGLMVAMGSSVVLLDEPMAGIAQREVEAFAPVLREIRDHLDATVLVIDHDIPMMMQLADRLYVMAAGELIAEGPPEAIREDPAVIAAYLGVDERAVNRSGVGSDGRPPGATGGVWEAFRRPMTSGQRQAALLLVPLTIALVLYGRPPDGPAGGSGLRSRLPPPSPAPTPTCPTRSPRESRSARRPRR